MKTLLLAASLLSLGTFANGVFDGEKIASQIRDKYEEDGYSYVESRVTKADEEYLTNYFKNDYFEEPGGDEIDELFNCITLKDCELHLITITADYMGGYGRYSHFILHNTKTLSNSEISHIAEVE